MLPVSCVQVGREKGCVAFPGGMKEDDDVDEVDTSLREAAEEIGLDRSLVEVVAVLTPHVALGTILVTPVVGFVSPDFRPNPNEEVDEVFSVPLRRFLTDVRHHSMPIEAAHMTMCLHFFQDVVRDKTFVTYGLTAHVCIEVAIAYFQRLPSFDYSLKLRMTVDNLFTLAERYNSCISSKL